MSSTKKRKRPNKVKIPTDIVHNESLELVSSALGPIRSSPVTAIDRDILFDRLRIELLDKYDFFLKISSSPSCEVRDERDCSTVEETQAKFLRKCLIVGTNECTRVLERATEVGRGTEPLTPSLVMLARDVRPPTILAHIPYLCKVLNIPIVLLPGKASSDAGHVFRRKRASAIVFMKGGKSKEKVDQSKIEKDICKKIDSYVNFVTSKIQKQELTVS